VENPIHWSDYIATANQSIALSELSVWRKKPRRANAFMQRHRQLIECGATYTNLLAKSNAKEGVTLKTS